MFCELQIILVDFVRVKIAVAAPVNCRGRTGLDLVPFPESVVFIADNAFPCLHKVRIANIDSCQELKECNEGRGSGSMKRLIAINPVGPIQARELKKNLRNQSQPRIFFEV
jgi:hypothetical protein